MGLLVVDPGFFTTVQDLGRPGARAFGVPLGGAFDRESLALANALAGNEPSCAALELTWRGGVFEARCDLGVALAGATMEAVIDGPDGRRILAGPASDRLRRGERLELGRAEDGARAYLATPGGFRTPAWMGSRSSERPLRAGDALDAGPSRLARRRLSAADRPADPSPIRLLPGPDWSSLDAPEILTEGEFRVGSRSNRMGLRLEGPPVAATGPADRLSTPVLPGTVQATGGGLIVLGVACGTMGGYLQPAQAASVDLDRLGRLRPGDSIRFAIVSHAEARRLDRHARQALRARATCIAAAARDGLG